MPVVYEHASRAIYEEGLRSSPSELRAYMCYVTIMRAGAPLIVLHE